MRRKRKPASSPLTDALAGHPSGAFELYRFLIRQARPYWSHLAGVLFLSLLATPLALLTPVPLKIAIDSGLGSHQPPGLLQPLLGDGASQTRVLLGAAALLVAVAMLTQLQELALKLLRASTGERLVMSMRTRLFRHLQQLSLSYHDARGTPDSLYRVQYDAPSIRYLAVDGLIPFVAAGFTLAGMLYVTARIDWQLALIALTISPVLFAIARAYRLRLRRGARGVKALESEALGVVQEVLSVLRVVKAFGQEEHEGERFAQRSLEGVRARLSLVRSEEIFALLVGAITAVGTGAVLLIGARHVRSGTLTLGDLLLVLGYLTQLYEPLRTMSKQVTSVQDSLASAERIFSLLEEAPEVHERPGARALERSRGAVVFDGVSFAYDGRAPALREVSFEVEAGTRVGIEGTTGAGKTTLVSLIARFYDPSAGRILLDGVDLRDYRLTDLRRQVAIVLQEPVLFAASIAENIAYARPDATEREVVAAAQAACAHNFIAALPDGYDTVVGERGMRLSGGERQRLSLARAFLKNAPILILDEPTSALDARTEAELFEVQERVMEGRTSIIVAHRPRLLEGCHLRLRLEAGRLIAPVRPGEEAPCWVTVREAAADLGCTEDWIRRQYRGGHAASVVEGDGPRPQRLVDLAGLRTLVKARPSPTPTHQLIASGDAVASVSVLAETLRELARQLAESEARARRAKVEAEHLRRQLTELQMGGDANHGVGSAESARGDQTRGLPDMRALPPAGGDLTDPRSASTHVSGNGPFMPPPGVLELAGRVLAIGDSPKLRAHEALKRSVHRVHFEVRGRRASVVIKRLSRRRAHVNALVAERWLPAIGLERACARVQGTFSEPEGRSIWQIYEDVNGGGLDHPDPDMRQVGYVVDLIAELHIRFAEHSLLGECRTYGDDLGMAFFTSHVSRSADHLRAIDAPPSGQQAALRDRLLARVEGLYDERHERASMLEALGGPATLLHGDLWTSNTLVVERDGDRRARLIDWDHAGAGPVSYDLSTFLYRFAAADRPQILARYRERLARASWQLPSDSDLNLLFETAECSRYACCLAEAALAASRGEAWGFEQLAEIETWFTALEPVLAPA